MLIFRFTYFSQVMADVSDLLQSSMTSYRA